MIKFCTDGRNLLFEGHCPNKERYQTAPNLDYACILAWHCENGDVILLIVYG